MIQKKNTINSMVKRAKFNLSIFLWARSIFNLAVSWVFLFIFAVAVSVWYSSEEVDLTDCGSCEVVMLTEWGSCRVEVFTAGSSCESVGFPDCCCEVEGLSDRSCLEVEGFTDSSFIKAGSIWDTRPEKKNIL